MRGWRRPVGRATADQQGRLPETVYVINFKYILEKCISQILAFANQASLFELKFQMDIADLSNIHLKTKVKQQLQTHLSPRS
jgi:hypothetical protein